jgi:hypothetical protein
LHIEIIVTTQPPFLFLKGCCKDNALKYIVRIY